MKVVILWYPALFLLPHGDSLRYKVKFLDLPGCVAEGDSREEALAMASEAASVWFQRETFSDFPVPTPIETIQIPSCTDDIPVGRFVSYVPVSIIQ